MSNKLHTYDEYEYDETKTLVEFFQTWSKYFKDCLIHMSWEVYLVLGFLVSFCIFCYMRHFKRKLEVKRRRQELQRSLERHILSTADQQMLSGAENVNNQIPGTAGVSVGVNILIGDNVDKMPSYMIMRSGNRIIFGHFEDDDFSDLDQSI